MLINFIMTLLTMVLKIDNMFVKTAWKQADNLDRQVLRFFFSENVPFKSVEGEEFVKLWKQADNLHRQVR